MKFEKEVKVLNIDVSAVQKNLEKLGATFVFDVLQKIYVYDVPSIYHRYLEICCFLASEQSSYHEVAINKLKLLLVEIEDQLSDTDISNICQATNQENLSDILTLPPQKMLHILRHTTVDTILQKLFINPDKWVRLRESNGKIELTVKHVLNKNTEFMQKVIENEINVSSLDEANLLLNALGLFRRSYQEKRRIQYKYKDAELDIDFWPNLTPYLEIETDNEATWQEIIANLGLENHRLVSQNTQSLYREQGIDVSKLSELRF